MIVSTKGGSYSFLIACWLVSAALLLFCTIPIARADDKDQKAVKVMEAFEQQASQDKTDRPLTIQKKHLAMFLLGVPLLIMLLITGGLGIAMGIYGKQVFVLHMISAGLTITLAFVHAIVGVIWFYPF